MNPLWQFLAVWESIWTLENRSLWHTKEQNAKKQEESTLSAKQQVFCFTSKLAYMQKQRGKAALKEVQIVQKLYNLKVSDLKNI